jgi:acetylornithine deacetylase/succinyl-diaminopimelate desuccinylase-like protein
MSNSMAHAATVLRRCDELAAFSEEEGRLTRRHHARRRAETIAPAAMLFVRCAGGVSHNPTESVTVEDVAAAIDATTRFLELLR